MEAEMLTTGDVARSLGVTINTVKAWARAGRLDAVVLPSGHFRIPRDELDRLRAEGPNARTAEDLIIQKSVSERARDHEDVVGVLRRRGQRLDLERVDATLRAISAEMGEPEIVARWDAAKRAADLG